MRYLVAVAVLCMAVGCGGGPEKPTTGGSSPEDVFNKIRTEFGQGNYEEAFNCFAPEDRDILLFGMQMPLGFASMVKPEIKAELDEVFKKHGVNVDIKMPDDPADANAMKETIGQMYKGVKDKAALFSDLMKIAAKSGDKKSTLVPKDAHLKDLKIDGDSATATIVEGEREQPVRFVKLDGRWYAEMKPPK